MRVAPHPCSWDVGSLQIDKAGMSIQAFRFLSEAQSRGPRQAVFACWGGEARGRRTCSFSALSTYAFEVGRDKSGSGWPPSKSFCSKPHPECILIRTESKVKRIPPKNKKLTSNAWLSL